MVLRFFILAAFLFTTCAEEERNNPYDPGSENYVPWGSSSSKQNSTYTLACAAVPSIGIVSTTIIPPVVTCDGIVVGYGLDWTNAPNWNNPEIGTYRDISIMASYGECNGKTASCSGTLTVIAAPSADELTCTGMPMTGIAGTAITQPTVRCGINTITSGIAWANAPDWDNPTASAYNVSATANCGGKQQTASCGTLTVASVLACATVPSSGTAGMAITAPTVTCDGKTVGNGLSWTGAPNWSNPAAGTYDSVWVLAISGNCNGKTATCSGRLKVVSSSSSVYSSSYEYGVSSSSKPSSSSIAPISSANVVSSTPVTYEGETYQTVVIGTQTWMARNMNYDASGSKCYNNGEANCATYGRLYNWATAMNLPSSCNSSTCSSQISTKHKGICPSGWHIPSNADWNILMKYINPSCSDNSSCAGAGTKLKAEDGWNSYSGVPKGTDEFGFSALPGGFGGSGGGFYSVGNYGSWWSASEYDSDYAYRRYMNYNGEDVDYYNYGKGIKFSVRCLQD